ncbi:MAG TPA: glycosyltransferase family 9 protein [Blastocatellia bacterium]|nr:glycosyltransferase family 9 protein [Blastocatellia bacterium]
MRRERAINLPDWSAVRKVLLIRLRSIGDTVLMTPCLAALKAMRPAIKITVVSEPLAAPVVEDHPLVDRLLIAERSLGGRARLIGQLRRAGYDVAFDLHGGTTATGLARFAAARWSVGYAGYRHSRWLDLRAPDPDVILGRKQVHSVEQQLALLHWAGVPWPVERPRLSLAVSSDAEQGVREKLEAVSGAQAVSLRTGFAVIAPAAAFESKRWPATGFAEIVRHLRERWALPSVVIAGPGQEPLAQEVAAQAGAVALCRLTLKELIALINQSRAFVGNDGGPMHIAAALSRPLVAVFGSSNPDVWHPWTDSPYRIVGGRWPVAGRRSVDTNTPDADGLFAIRRVAANEVIAAADDVLKLALAAS